MGLDPGPFTLRELLWMVEARQSDQWNHTTDIVCTLINLKRDKSQRRIRPEEIHPFSKRQAQAPVEQADISVLKKFL